LISVGKLDQSFKTPDGTMAVGRSMEGSVSVRGISLGNSPGKL
jgi:hypothetical protein